MIRRKPYWYTHKKTGKRIYVSSTMIKDVGKKGRTPESKKVLPKLKPGKLSNKGYSTTKSTMSRKRALMKASKHGDRISKKKVLKNYRRLVVLKNYTKRSQPNKHKIYFQDAKWMSKKYKEI